VVGAPGEISNTSPGAGAAYVFTLAAAGGVPQLVATLNYPDLVDGGRFGASVGILGGTVIVGAPGKIMDHVQVGEAYVFSLASSPPPLVQTLVNPLPTGGDDFGASVAIAGGFAAVVSPGEDSGGPGMAAVYIFDAAKGDILRTVTLPTGASNFGYV